MSGTFSDSAGGGSYCGSPPRARDKFIPKQEHGDIKGSWFDHKKPTPTPTQKLHNVNDRVFLRGDPWVRVRPTRSGVAIASPAIVLDSSC